MSAIVAPVSRNPKTGPMLAIYYPRRSCPSTCPLRGDGGCYGENGPLAWNWNRLDRSDADKELQVLQAIKRQPRGAMWRDAVVGDQKPTTPNGRNICEKTLKAKTRANAGRPVLAFTHHRINKHNLRVLRDALRDGFQINLSADNLRDADRKADTGLPVTVVMPSDAPKVSWTPKGRKVVRCPASNSGKKVTCSTCGMCARTRDYIIGFPAHGTRKKTINKRF